MSHQWCSVVASHCVCIIGVADSNPSFPHISNLHFITSFCWVYLLSATYSNVVWQVFWVPSSWCGAASCCCTHRLWVQLLYPTNMAFLVSASYSFFLFFSFFQEIGRSPKNYESVISILLISCTACTLRPWEWLHPKSYDPHRSKEPWDDELVWWRW